MLLRFLSRPKDFTWKELVALLEGLGYSKVAGGKSGGSRVRFVHAEHPPISLHRPHPGSVLKRYQVEQIEEVLRGEGVI